ncbi:MAG: TetR/AcrR family transcriptional regulator [Desulfomonilia bacterium]|jgi:TetR/AcrR family fatty acid metabolism transcriptional regulator|uniref:Fatty acid metabolism regulator protein n=1 Tax=anaerobic digester metagenome TaxID=1263854 RepID=A0A485M6Q0_9ZZZZ|nr:TetR/AcrR family transcriptional regulator [Pseudomonadota bacterium]HON37865.1 TetR/AcrR family transcriptional regulator [Deltaproteobacteria bacterium]HPD21124.1 TetR/AcrR family transcriptional regulator [Deltaproteobacteria bacterium]HRS55913.1 TetR/AcrR family transcriptional regulator [Desulfomonilia bacterium]HRV35695.1 TetR/AcrR family transcriptional regulator [Desulfomonilia bacterium]
MARTSPKEQRRERIIESALKIFAEKGFQDATISEISKAAGVSDATVYEYFKTKEDLLFVIPEEITERSIREIRGVMPFLRGAESKLRAIVQGYVTTYENNPEYANLIMLQLKTNRNFLKTRAFEVVREAAQVLLSCIQEGIDEGTFRKDADPYLVRAMILGTIEHLFTRRHLQGTPGSLMDKIDPLVDLILDGIRARKKSGEVSLHLHITGQDILPFEDTSILEEKKT